jgi:hypothetical protein
MAEGGPRQQPDDDAGGGHTQGVVDLLAGRWIFIDPIGGRNVAILTVAEGTPAPAAEPLVDAAITMQEMSFSGLDAPLRAGPQVWRIINNGALDHEIAVVAVPAGTTSQDVIGMIGDMLAGSAPPETFAPGWWAGDHLEGRHQLASLDLPTGTYAAACMSPMPGKDFEPDALEGMVQVFTVA